MPTLSLDIESRSKINLKNCGGVALLRARQHGTAVHVLDRR